MSSCRSPCDYSPDIEEWEFPRPAAKSAALRSSEVADKSSSLCRGTRVVAQRLTSRRVSTGFLNPCAHADPHGLRMCDAGPVTPASAHSISRRGGFSAIMAHASGRSTEPGQ